jgi:hypothetical protein
MFIRCVRTVDYKTASMKPNAHVCLVKPFTFKDILMAYLFFVNYTHSLQKCESLRTLIRNIKLKQNFSNSYMALTNNLFQYFTEI